MIDELVLQILILVVSLIAACSVVYIVSRKEISALKQSLALLESQKESLDSQLTTTRDTLEKTSQDLTANKENAQALNLEYEKIKVNFHNTQRQLEVSESKKEEYEQRLGTLSEEKSKLSSELSATRSELQEKQSLLAGQLDDLKARLKDAEQSLKTALNEKESLSNRLASLDAGMAEKEKSFAEQQKSLEAQQALLQKEFENLANRIFENKGKTFNEQSRQTLNDLLHPFRQQMSEFKQKVEDIHIKDVQQQTALSKELNDLKALNLSMTEQAHNLATALQGQKKTQGNWGELILENILDSSGLVKGRDYEREASFNTDEGRSRPDAIVYLPQGKHLIIDAKVSLNAYTRYINAEGEAERVLALKEHVSAFGDRIKELSDRNYYQIEELNSPEMVFMFVPIESAFVEALKADSTLFQKAIEQNVLVATPTTLLTSLNIVKQLWRFEDQNKHTAEIADRAGKIYDKLNTFLGSMQGIGKQLDKAKDHYDKAFAQLYSGRGNLVKQVSDFKRLGVSVKTDLDHSVVEKAEMELNLLADDSSFEEENDVSTIEQADAVGIELEEAKQE